MKIELTFSIFPVTYNKAIDASEISATPAQALRFVESPLCLVDIEISVAPLAPMQDNNA